MKFNRLPAVKLQLGYVADETVYDQIRRGLLPKGVNIGTRAVAWPDFELEQIQKARIAGFTDSQLRQLVQQIYAARAALLPEGYAPRGTPPNQTVAQAASMAARAKRKADAGKEVAV